MSISSFFHKIFHKSPKEEIPQEEIPSQPAPEILAVDSIQLFAENYASVQIEQEFYQKLSETQNVDEIPDEKLQELFTAYVEQMPKEEKQQKLDEAQELVTSNLAYFKDEFISMDPQRFIDAYSNFVQFTGANDFLEAYGNKEETYQLDALRDYVADVPALAEVVDTMYLQFAYNTITASSNTVTNKDLEYFASMCQKSRSHLSNENMATLYYIIATEYNKIDNNNKYKDYLLRALTLTNDPKMISDTYEALPSDYNSKNNLARMAIARALKNPQIKENPEKWRLHKIWADTYRIDHIIGPKSLEAKDKYRHYNKFARIHYLAAAWDAPQEEVPLLAREISQVGGKGETPHLRFKNIKNEKQSLQKSFPHNEDLIAYYIMSMNGSTKSGK